MLRTLSALLLSAGLVTLVAQEPKKDAPKAKPPERIAINDPAKLKDDADFAVQGEYAGSGRNLTEDKKVKQGGQVVALGDGRFDFVTFEGGLPGEEGARRVESDVKLTTKRIGGTVTVYADKKAVATIADGVAASLDGVAKGLKIERKSPTMGAKPPAGADVLFGAAGDEANWDGGKLVKLSDGEFLGVGCKSKKAYADFTAHAEFRLPWMPNSRGQGRGNSGFYLQDRYEVQVLDSFGLKGENNECGGVYTLAKPSVNMCFPPMSWQTYDVDFTAAKFDAAGKKTTAARITVKHNGVLVHDNVELKNATGGGQAEGPTPGPFQLQNHGDPVVYRNIWAIAR